MEENTLTTAPKEEHVETNDEQTQDEPQVEQTTTEESYDDAWDSIDVDNPKTVDKVFVEQNEKTEGDNDGLQEEEEQESEEEIARKAFMEAAPVLKFKGKEVPIDSPDEIVALAQKGLSFEQDMSKIKPYKKIINTVSDVPLEILQAVADLNQGKQEALDYLKEHYGIEDTSNADDYTFGYDNEEGKEKSKSTYQPEVADDDPVKEYWDSVVEEDTELAATVTKVYSDIDAEFQNALYDPNIFPAFVKSVETGEFDTVYPIALKEKSLNPAMDWITAYQTAASKIGITENGKEEPPASAQPPKTSGKRHLEETVSADDIWADDEAFERMQKQIFG